MRTKSKILPCPVCGIVPEMILFEPSIILERYQISCHNYRSECEIEWELAIADNNSEARREKAIAEMVTDWNNKVGRMNNE